MGRCLNPYSNGMLTWIMKKIISWMRLFVLILILMECSLGLCIGEHDVYRVLILILMECSLGVANVQNVSAQRFVLILILMECSLGRQWKLLPWWTRTSLNPYSNGMLTWEVVWGEWVEGDYCLNPYSNGMLTWFLCLHVERLKHGCLNPYSNGMLTWFNTR